MMKKFFTLVLLCTVFAISSCSHKIYDNTNTYSSDVNVSKVYTEVQHDTLSMYEFRAMINDNEIPSLDK